MSFFPVPDVMKNSIYELEPRLFQNRGIRFLLIDIDNTVAPYAVDAPTPRMTAWVQRMKDAGLELFVLSNNRSRRPAEFAAAFGLQHRGRAWKPFTKNAREVMAERGYTPAETAFIGDQIYTDVACAKWCGAFAIAVQPIALSNFFLRIRYWLEVPFRLKYKWKYMK